MPVRQWLRIFAFYSLAALVSMSLSCSDKKKSKSVAPMITSTARTMETIGSLYSYTITTTGNPNPSLSVSGIPYWLAFDGNNLISGTPASSDLGLSQTIVIIASNGILPDASQSFAITVRLPIYVKIDATGADDGSSWNDAFSDLQDALALATTGCDIWIATGLYKPTSGTDRSISFVMSDDVDIFGGFSGSETSVSERDVQAHITVLSGDIGTLSHTADNSYHVVIGANNIVIDGFIIEGGCADSMYNWPNNAGGGVIIVSVNMSINNTTIQKNKSLYGGGICCDTSSLTMSNCVLSENRSVDFGAGICNIFSTGSFTDCIFEKNYVVNYGSGMFNYESNPTIVNCEFRENIAMYCGGGMANSYNASPIIIDCAFRNNTVLSGEGGGIYNNNHSSPIISNCVFIGNNGSAFGGGILNNYDSSPTLTNCVFCENSASRGGGIYNVSSSPILMNCTFSGNRSNQGSGIYNFNKSSSRLTNCILWNDSASSGNQIYNVGDLSYGSTAIITHCDIRDGISGIHNDPQSSVTDNGDIIDLNPLFINAPNFMRMTCLDGSSTAVIISNAEIDFIPNDVIEINNDGTHRIVTNVVGDTIIFTPALSAASVADTIVHNWGPGATDLEFNLQLQPSSPCIDAGTSTGAPETDILGVERPQGAGVDMGAYEQ